MDNRGSNKPGRSAAKKAGSGRKAASIVKHSEEKRAPSSSGSTKGRSKSEKQRFKDYERNTRKTLGRSFNFSKILSETLDFLSDKSGMLAGGAFVLLIMLIIFIIWSLTSKNAYEVFVNDVPVGIIAMNKKITGEELYNTAVTKLAAQEGTRVSVNEKVSIKPVHAAKRNITTTDYIVSEISKNFTYKIEAATITLDGIEMAVLKNSSEANEVLQRIIEPYINSETPPIEQGFVENVSVGVRFAEKDQVMKPEQAYIIMTENKETVSTYVIKSGDSLSKICSVNGISLQSLLDQNPDINVNSILKIGQELKMITFTPLLSVKTVDEVKLTEVAQKPVETKNNPDRPKTYKNVIKQGRDGQKEVTYHIIRVNGFETEKIPVEEIITVAPEPEIIEVGTMQTPPKQALGFYIMPTWGAVSDYFGSRGGAHNGVDIAADFGSPVYAADGGKVIYAENGGTFGQLIKIRHNAKVVSYYAHNSELLVKAGQNVAQGQLIALMGNTGDSTGSHLHFEIRENGVPQNPFDYINIK